MKKTLCILLFTAVLLSGCGSQSGTPVRTIEPSVTPSAGEQNITDTNQSDKMNDTTYAGELTELTGDKISILMDGKTTETFNLNERAKRDIGILGIKVGDRIIIVFDSPETRNITSVQKIESEL